MGKELTRVERFLDKQMGYDPLGKLRDTDERDEDTIKSTLEGTIFGTFTEFLEYKRQVAPLLLPIQTVSELEGTIEKYVEEKVDVKKELAHITTPESIILSDFSYIVGLKGYFQELLKNDIITCLEEHKKKHFPQAEINLQSVHSYSSINQIKLSGKGGAPHYEIVFWDEGIYFRVFGNVTRKSRNNILILFNASQEWVDNANNITEYVNSFVAKANRGNIRFTFPGQRIKNDSVSGEKNPRERNKEFSVSYMKKAIASKKGIEFSPEGTYNVEDIINNPVFQKGFVCKVEERENRIIVYFSEIGEYKKLAHKRKNQRLTKI